MRLRMPAEWERHEATWIAWPHNVEDWPGRFEPIPWVYGEIVRKLSQAERVHILIQNDEVDYNARNVLQKVGADFDAIEFFRVETDRVWARDFAPLFVHGADGQVVATKWRFNGWAKYENHLRDEAAGATIPELIEVPAQFPDMVLEGGSIDVNGQGLLLTTQECLLSPIQARNPELTLPQIEEQMAEFLGIEQVLWLNKGIVGDDTHGHVDDLARFTGPDTVVIVQEDDRSEANYDALRENWEILNSFPVRAVKLPMPAPLYFDGTRLPASYANFYIANTMVLVPTFNDPNDRVALNTLAGCFPGRKIIGIDCTQLVWGLGTLHCMTQQQPARK